MDIRKFFNKICKGKEKEKDKSNVNTTTSTQIKNKSTSSIDFVSSKYTTYSQARVSKRKRKRKRKRSSISDIGKMTLSPITNHKRHPSPNQWHPPMSFDQKEEESTTTIATRRHRVDHNEDTINAVLACLKTNKVNIFDKKDLWRFDIIINYILSSKYPGFLKVSPNGTKVITAKKMKQIRRMIKTWWKEGDQHKLNYCANNPLTVYRASGAGRKCLIGKDIQFMIFKFLNLENTKGVHSRFDLLLIFDVILWPPNTLILVLKRFNDYNEKIKKPIKINEILDIGPYSTSYDAAIQYKLCGIVIHCGITPIIGHYFSFISQNNIWYSMNDTNIARIGSFSNISSKTLAFDSYLLFYEKTSC